MTEAGPAVHPAAPAATRCAVAGLLLVLACAAAADGAGVPRLGQPLGTDELAGVDRAVLPDGQGLPPGGGGVARGQALFAERCAACHGRDGLGGSAGRLVGRAPLLASPWPEKTIGQYWPWATTVFDYIRRAMPWQAPGTLTPDEAYALTAWLLHANGIVPADATLDARTLPAVRMPNRDGFVRAAP